MSWFKQLIPSRIRTKAKKIVPEGLWSRCENCHSILYRAELEHNLEVCPKCNFHQRINVRTRLQHFLDTASIIEFATDVQAVDWLEFKDSRKYKDRLIAAQNATGETEALIVCQGKLHGLPLIVAAFNFEFMGGSMGAAVGERFVQAVQRCIELGYPLVCFCASGGARMQEAVISLLQMAKTSAALAKLAQKNYPFISILTNPTMGGVSASLAMLGDLIVAEPGALIGFAGPRVIEQVVRQTLPKGFQRSEFLLAHGAIDMIIDRREMRDRIAKLLNKIHRLK